MPLVLKSVVAQSRQSVRHFCNQGPGFNGAGAGESRREWFLRRGFSMLSGCVAGYLFLGNNMPKQEAWRLENQKINDESYAAREQRLSTLLQLASRIHRSNSD